jgi:hypothetical protein
MLSGVARTLPAELPFSGGAVGYVSYDCVKYFEPTVHISDNDPLGCASTLAHTRPQRARAPFAQHP